MVYAHAARKTASFMVLSMVLSLALVVFFSGSVDAPTGNVTSAAAIGEASSGTLIVFLLGVFVGALVVGTYTYIVHLEAKRKE